jgi:hypothetical protein
MTIGQRERIVYRVVVRSRSGATSFLPPVGAGLDGDGLGILLHKMVKGPPRVRLISQTVTGVVVAETGDSVTIKSDDGRRVRIATKDIIERIVVQ